MIDEREGMKKGKVQRMNNEAGLLKKMLTE